MFVCRGGDNDPIGDAGTPTTVTIRRPGQTAVVMRGVSWASVYVTGMTRDTTITVALGAGVRSEATATPMMSLAPHQEILGSEANITLAGYSGVKRNITWPGYTDIMSVPVLAGSCYLDHRRNGSRVVLYRQLSNTNHLVLRNIEEGDQFIFYDVTSDARILLLPNWDTFHTEIQ